jgi:hypothetical protein
MPDNEIQKQQLMTEVLRGDKMKKSVNGNGSLVNEPEG